MGKSGSRKSARKSARAWWLAGVLLALLAGLGWYYRAPAQGFTDAATAYSARVGCSCRFVAGRSLEDCEKDRLDGLEFVTLVEDPQAKSITARFPLLSSDVATYREGYGCVLQKWDR